MNASSNDPSTAPASTTRAAPRDVSFLLVGSLFIFMGIAGLIDREWIDGAGWLAMTLGLVVLVASKPVTDENWKQPRYLVCLALFVAGVSLLLVAPGHHTQRARPPLSHPAASVTPNETKP